MDFVAVDHFVNKVTEAHHPHTQVHISIWWLSWDRILFFLSLEQKI